jgi:thiamine-phosphate pyrophosphorylase
MTSDSQESTAALRIFDAAANRALEGLRVVEDVARFGMDDQHLTACLKDIRHACAEAISKVDVLSRVRSRETQADVGTEIRTRRESDRQSLADILTANFRRTEESLRTLAETAKLLQPQLAERFEQSRYQLYTVERAVTLCNHSNDTLAQARLYVLVSGMDNREILSQYASVLIDGNVDIIQLRDKSLDDRELIERARLLRELTRNSSTQLIINDRPDVAAIVNADAVHVGQEEMSVKDARQIVGPNCMIGVSCHSIEQARAAVLDGADYLGVGPTFPSSTKCFTEFPGLELIQAVAAEITLPAFAIGGINLENVEQVMAAGLSRVAVQGAIQGAEDVAGAIDKFHGKLQ